MSPECKQELGVSRTDRRGLGISTRLNGKVMGRIWTNRITVVTTLSETVGHKSGLALSREEMREHLSTHHDVLDGRDEDTLGLRAEVFGEMVAKLLYQIGNIPSPDLMIPGLALYEKYRSDPENLEILEQIVELYAEVSPDIQWVHETTGKPVNLDPFMTLVVERIGGGQAIPVALDYIQSLQYAAHIDPWSQIRFINWVDIKDLSDLFESEGLDTQYGKFFDQRFIDYLNQNFQAIDEMNWRQFEGLAAEFFEREGFHVEIGPGRNDEGVDARVWPSEEDASLPPTILVQCKRQKTKVEKVVVKALWADVSAESAESGLIVTTSSLSPGAKQLSIARAYPIGEANRDAVRQWVKNMRSLHAGVFLGE